MAPIGELLELGFGLLTEIHVAGAVNFLRDAPDFLRERFVQGIERVSCWRGIFFRGGDNFFREIFCAGAPFGEAFG